jgi:hypothetical protein
MFSSFLSFHLLNQKNKIVSGLADSLAEMGRCITRIGDAARFLTAFHLKYAALPPICLPLNLHVQHFFHADHW